MAWTSADIEALERAIANGAVVSSMTFGETTITFRSLKDMREQLAMMKQAVGQTPRVRFGATSKGA